MSCGSKGFYVLGVVLDMYFIRGDLLLMNELVFHFTWFNWCSITLVELTICWPFFYPFW